MLCLPFSTGLSWGRAEAAAGPQSSNFPHLIKVRNKLWECRPYLLLNGNPIWETQRQKSEAASLELHKGKWLSSQRESMLVMISPLMSDFPQTRLWELACRCHRVSINLFKPIECPGIISAFLGHSGCIGSSEQHGNSGISYSFVRNASPSLLNSSYPTFALSWYTTAT